RRDYRPPKLRLRWLPTPAATIVLHSKRLSSCATAVSPIGTSRCLARPSRRATSAARQFSTTVPGLCRQARCAYRAHRPRRAQGGQMELALLWRRGHGWFLGIHCFTHYVKVAFFRGASLSPVPPGESKSKDTRYLDIHEHD